MAFHNVGLLTLFFLNVVVYNNQVVIDELEAITVFVLSFSFYF